MALPGVASVAWTSTSAAWRLRMSDRFSFEIVGDPPVDESQRPVADYQIVSSRYFRTLDLPIVAGRGFDERDTPTASPSAS